MNNNKINKSSNSLIARIIQSSNTFSSLSIDSKEYSLVGYNLSDKDFTNYNSQQYIKVLSPHSTSLYYSDRVYAVSIKSLSENLQIIETLKTKGYNAYLPFQNTCHYIIYVSIDKVSAMSDKLSILSSINKDNTFADINFSFDGLVETNAIPNDSWYNLQWYLPFVDMEKAWDITKGSGNVIVAVLDTGVGNPDNQYGQDIKPKLIPGSSFIIGEPSTFDEYWHGTACAYIIGSATNNSFKMAGLDWNCKICPIKVLNKAGIGSWSAGAAGMMWAADNNCDVLSCSFSGGPGISTDSGVGTAIDYAISKNCVVVVSAGNSGPDGNNPPANYYPVISVGAVDKDKNLASFSSKQSGDLGGKSNNKMTVCAPGVDVLTMDHVDAVVDTDGTSFACPIVAGCCALLKSLDKSLTHNTIKNIIQSSTGSSYIDDYRGYGIINVKNALINRNPPTPTPTCTTTPTITPTKTATPTVTKTNTPTKTVTPSITPTLTPTPSSRARYHEISIEGLTIDNFSNSNILDVRCCVTAQPTPSSTATPTNTPTKTTSPTPTNSRIPTNTQSPTTTPTTTPTSTSTPANTSTPTRPVNDTPDTVTSIGLAGWNYGSGRVATISNTAGIKDINSINYARLVINTCKWLAKNKNNLNVLILTSENTTYNNLLQNILETNDISCTIISTPWYNYTGTGLANMDVLLPTGNYNWAAGLSMPTSGQSAILDFISNGGGLFTFEWTIWRAAISPDSFSLLKDCFPVIPNSSYNSRTRLRYKRFVPESTINNGLQSEFQWIPENIGGVETHIYNIKSGATIFYQSIPAEQDVWV